MVHSEQMVTTKIDGSLFPVVCDLDVWFSHHMCLQNPSLFEELFFNAPRDAVGSLLLFAHLRPALLSTDRTAIIAPERRPPAEIQQQHGRTCAACALAEESPISPTVGGDLFDDGPLIKAGFHRDVQGFHYIPAFRMAFCRTASQCKYRVYFRFTLNAMYNAANPSPHPQNIHVIHHADAAASYMRMSEILVTSPR